MSLDRSCPGSRAIREPEPDDFPCPECGTLVEIWSDEKSRRCPSCGGKVLRTGAKIPSCATWCGAARECLGARLYDHWLEERRGQDGIPGA